MKKNKKKICFLTSTRADYGLLKDLINKFKKSKNINTKIIACGTHFSSKFGFTYRELYEDNLNIDIKIKIKISDDSSYASSIFFSEFAKKFSRSLKKINPDLLIILGDRFEILAAASVAVINNVPICHLHGGESTEGLIDDSIRHAVTKLSSLHFVSHKKYKKRIIQMGENPSNIYNVGALGLNSIKDQSFASIKQLEKKLNIKTKSKNIIVTYHPVTLQKNTNKHIDEILKAIKLFKECCFIITAPNMDTEHNQIIYKLKNFAKLRKNIYYFKSLGKQKYFDTLNLCDGVMGNSSSGIIEASSFKKGTINIGERQKGRIQSKSVINCKPIKKDIAKSIKKLISKKFKKSIEKIKNPYFKINTENKILAIIEKKNLENLIKKPFVDHE